MEYYFKDERAMTLIEILIAITMIMIILIPVLGFFTSNIRYVNQSKQRSQALFVARQVLEHLKDIARKQFYDKVEFETCLKKYINSANFTEVNLAEWNTVNIPNNFTNLKYTAEVCFRDQSSADLKKASVRVKWDSEDKNIELITLIRRRE